MIEGVHKRAVADIPIFECGEVTSTHDVAFDLLGGESQGNDFDIENRSPGDLIGAISATNQTKGRGRRSRVWESSAGSSLLVTFIISKRPSNQMVDVANLLVAICQSIQSAKPELPEIKIKWPNDLVVGEETIKKLGGCLTEVEERFLLVGIGINLNESSYSSDLEPIATSLLEQGLEISSAELLDKIIEKYQERKDQINSEYEIWADYKAICNTMSKKVRVDQINASVVGLARDIAEDGALVLELENGEQVRILEGDVINLRPEI